MLSQSKSQPEFQTLQSFALATRRRNRIPLVESEPQSEFQPQSKLQLHRGQFVLLAIRQFRLPKPESQPKSQSSTKLQSESQPEFQALQPLPLAAG